MLCCVALVRTHVSEELSTSIIRVTRIGELGRMLAITSQMMAFFIVTTMKTSNLTFSILFTVRHAPISRFKIKLLCTDIQENREHT
jgi:hypothetical protein